MPKRYAVVGTGSRAAMYVEALAGPYADVGEVVAWCEPNSVRMRYYDEVLAAAGRQAPARYGPDDFKRLLDEQRPNAVVVTSPDATHHRYATAALEYGAQVIVEKPLTTTLESAHEIVKAIEGSSAELVVTFNYRYSPRNSEVRRLLDQGAIGKVTSVHFEWVLDTVHGADYFRRWHRLKDVSGGLLVHKSSHHFDLVNWWLSDVAQTVVAAGGLKFYGDRNAAERGLTGRPARSHGAVEGDPFALDLAGDEKLRRLYLEAEGEDGYIRDQDVFSPGITIEDNLGLLVTYRSGAVFTYSLNAHSPWEGYRVAINGTAGRLELEVVERSFVPGVAAAVDPSVHPDERSAGTKTNPRPAGERLLLQRHWERAVEVPIPVGDGAHGGGDGQLLDDLFRPDPAPDPLQRRAGYRDGLRSIAIGIAGNRSLESGSPVELTDFGLPLDRE